MYIHIHIYIYIYIYIYTYIYIYIYRSYIECVHIETIISSDILRCLSMKLFLNIN